MTVVRALTALALLAAAGCDSEDKAVLKQKRYLLDVELTQKRNLASDLKSAKADLARLQRVFTGLETDYSDGNLIAAMDAHASVRLARLDTDSGALSLQLSSPRSLAKELEHLRDSSFPAFEIRHIEWDEGGMTVDLLVPLPNLEVDLTGSAPSMLSTPNGHWWDGSQQIRADCDALAKDLVTVDAQLADAGEGALLHDLAVYKARAEEALKANAHLRGLPRYVPPELPLMMTELPEGSWSRESGKGIGAAKATDAALRALTSLQPSAARDGDQITWSAALP